MLLYFYVYNIFLFHFDILVNSFLHFKDWVHLCFYRAKGLMLLCKLFMAKKRARRTIYRAGARLQINPTTWCLLNRELMSVVSIASSLRACMMGIDASSISRITMFVPADYPVFVLWSEKYFLHICFFAAHCADIFIFCRRTVLMTGRLSTYLEFFSMRITRCLLRTFRRKSSASPLLLRCQHRVKNCCWC